MLCNCTRLQKRVVRLGQIGSPQTSSLSRSLLKVFYIHEAQGLNIINNVRTRLSSARRCVRARPLTGHGKIKNRNREQGNINTTSSTSIMHADKTPYLIFFFFWPGAVVKPGVAFKIPFVGQSCLACFTAAANIYKPIWADTYVATAESG